MSQSTTDQRPAYSNELYLFVKNEYDSTSLRCLSALSLRKPHGCFSKGNEIQGAIRIPSEENIFGKKGDSFESPHDTIERVTINSHASLPRKKAPFFSSSGGPLSLSDRWGLDLDWYMVNPSRYSFGYEILMTDNSIPIQLREAST